MDKGNLVFIKHRGTQNEATLMDGTTVTRQEQLYISDELVKCAPYDNHFLYILPSHIKGWGILCTCGFGGGVVGYNAYKEHASPTNRAESTVPGKLVVCMSHANSGKHSDGSL